MTGYGRARQTLNGRDITVEVRSVNNRYLDCTVKVPRTYIFAEDAVKARVQKAVSRGKVDVFITIDAAAADETVVAVNEPLARGYYEALTRLKDMFSLEDGLNAGEVPRCADCHQGRGGSGVRSCRYLRCAGRGAGRLQRHAHRRGRQAARGYRRPC